jgi:hypothetical protein
VIGIAEELPAVFLGREVVGRTVMHGADLRTALDRLPIDEVRDRIVAADRDAAMIAVHEHELARRAGSARACGR